jgi:hypothetical protein
MGGASLTTMPTTRSQKARDVLIEFVGGEPAEQLRDQFRGGSQGNEGAV